jgi:hypothetical protein
MKHTPYGYRIENGKALVNEEEAETIRRIVKNYLAGMSLTEAASTEGLSRSHRWVKMLLLNRKYLGDAFYPPILTEDTMKACENEIRRRYVAYGIAKRPRKKREPIRPQTEFSMLPATRSCADPVKQAEYVYGLVKRKVMK